MIRKNPLSWSIRQICVMIDKGTITFDNPNQRPPGQWDHASATLLIDSIFRMFVPDIIAIQKQGEINDKTVNIYDVIDGKQRLTLFYDYKKDLWALGDIEPITLEATGESYNISGMKFSELPKDVQDEIDSFTLVIRPIEAEEGEDEEDVVSLIMYRLNNGKAMTREHLALLAAPLNIKQYVQTKIKEHTLFKEKAHFPDGSIKKSGREMVIMQSIILTGSFSYESFVPKDVEKAIVNNITINDDDNVKVIQHNNMVNQVLQKVDQAFDVIASVFPEKNKFISKVNIPAFVNLLVENNFDDNVVQFIKAYSKNIKKGDPYRKYSAGTKKSDVENKLKGIQTLYEQYLSGVIETKSGQTELTV